MTITRRGFLGYCIASAAALKLTSLDLLKLRVALADPNAQSFVWLVGSACSGCSISLLNRLSTSGANPNDVNLPSLGHLLLGCTDTTCVPNPTYPNDSINLIYHPTLMAAAGETASDVVQNLTAGSYVLVVEGGVPTAFGGACCIPWSRNGVETTFKQAVTDLAANAKYIVTVGTCASFGGVPASGPNPGGVVKVSDITQRPDVTVNVPGCPPNPDWIVWTIVQLLSKGMPTLDNMAYSINNNNIVTKRPVAIYGTAAVDDDVHHKCKRLNNAHATDFGQDNLCLMKLGCNGPGTHAPCPIWAWNRGTDLTVNSGGWCVDANANCLGCTEPTFPNASPQYPDFYTPPNS